jgi:hypothetical protein
MKLPQHPPTESHTLTVPFTQQPHALRSTARIGLTGKLTPARRCSVAPVGAMSRATVRIPPLSPPTPAPTSVPVRSDILCARLTAPSGPPEKPVGVGRQAQRAYLVLCALWLLFAARAVRRQQRRALSISLTPSKFRSLHRRVAAHLSASRGNLKVCVDRTGKPILDHGSLMYDPDDEAILRFLQEGYRPRRRGRQHDRERRRGR